MKRGGGVLIYLLQTCNVLLGVLLKDEPRFV